MTEAELLLGISEALEWGDWELKSRVGILTPAQMEWQLALQAPGIDVRVIRPADYDAALAVILRDTPPAEAFR
jgi:hypothetical protein